MIFEILRILYIFDVYIIGSDLFLVSIFIILWKIVRFFRIS